MHGLIERIQEDDPSYDPVALACYEAGVERERFVAAFDRVYIEGSTVP